MSPTLSLLHQPPLSAARTTHHLLVYLTHSPYMCVRAVPTRTSFPSPEVERYLSHVIIESHLTCKIRGSVSNCRGQAKHSWFRLHLILIVNLSAGLLLQIVHWDISRQIPEGLAYKKAAQSFRSLASINDEKEALNRFSYLANTRKSIFIAIPARWGQSHELFGGVNK